MGFFKQMKDMKDMVETAPGQIRAAQALGAQAQEMGKAQQAAAAAQMAAFSTGTGTVTAAAGTPTATLDPVAGVSLELYVEISKSLAAYGYDQSKGVEVAASKGVSAESWAAAVEGWNTRIKADHSVAQQFNRLYTGR